MGASRGVDQPCSDTDLAVGGLKATLDKVSRTERATDLSYIGIALPVREGGVPGDHHQIGEPSGLTQTLDTLGPRQRHPCCLAEEADDRVPSVCVAPLANPVCGFHGVRIWAKASGARPAHWQSRIAMVWLA